MSKIKVNRLENTSTANGGIDIDTSGHVQVDGLQMPTAGPLSNRNRIINGKILIDQRNNGVTVTSASGYSVDRWQTALAAGAIGDISYGRSSTSPSGFQYSLLHTVTTAHAAVAGDFLLFQQFIEGHNIADLDFGSSDAKTITVSFWVRCSVTGTYSVAVSNGTNNRSYVTTFVVNSADTFEYKQVTIPGDTSGTWATDSGKGMALKFDLGSGSNYVAASTNSWVATDTFKAAGSTSLCNTNGATFYITGVQLEVGSKATPFEHESYGQTLAKCQRYTQVYKYSNTYRHICQGIIANGYTIQNELPLASTMRVQPSCTLSDITHFRLNDYRAHDEDANAFLGIETSSLTPNVAKISFGKPTANMDIGRAGYMNVSTSAGGNCSITFSAEL